MLTIAWKYQNDPVEVRIEATKENRPQITQYVINTEREQKYENLLYLLDSDVYQKIMVFINTKDMTQRLCKRLKDAGYPAECLHGDMRQSVRNEVMQGFRKGKFQILLATDVAASTWTMWRPSSITTCPTKTSITCTASAARAAPRGMVWRSLC